MTVENGTTSVADFGRTLNRVGNVTSESQALDGVTGLAGSETQSFTYDALRRLTSSAISDGTTSDARSYTYDAGSRRTSKTENGVVTTYAYDRNDQLVSQTVGGGAAESFAYDAYGRMATRASGGGAVTNYAYDAADRLVGVTAPGGDPETFTLDALGRKWTRSLDGSLTDTYTYLDDSYSIVRIEQAALTIDSAIDAIGTRIATGTSAAAFGFALPDLHGNFAAAMGAGGTTISDAFRYDGYGQILAEATSVLPTPWRFQGKPLLSDVGDDLYDFESRAYDPGTGTFTQLDTVSGSIQNPLTLNRFLYAHANPTTLIDPDGHRGVLPGPMIDGEYTNPNWKPSAPSYKPPPLAPKYPVTPTSPTFDGPSRAAPSPAPAAPPSRAPLAPRKLVKASPEPTFIDQLGAAFFLIPNGAAAIQDRLWANIEAAMERDCHPNDMLCALDSGTARMLWTSEVPRTSSGDVISLGMVPLLPLRLPAAPSSRLVPGGGLQAHTPSGGHTLAGHVAWSDDALVIRANTSRVSAASSFTDRATAEAAVARAIDAKELPSTRGLRPLARSRLS